jgi:hypothetical protein
MIRIESILSINRALWEKVTPNVRGVAFSHVDNIILIRVFFDGEPSENDVERMLCAETEVMADFLPEVQVKVNITNLPVPEILFLCKGEEWVYLRCEDNDL